MSTRNRELDNLAHRLDRAANTIGDIWDHLDEQRANITHIAANDPSRPNSSGAVSDPTLHTVEQLAGVEYRRTEIRDHLATLELAVNLLEQSCRQALSFRVGARTDDQSHLQHTRTCVDCGQIPTTRTDRNGGTIDDGRCIDCGVSYDRVRMAAAAQRLVQRIRNA